MDASIVDNTPNTTLSWHIGLPTTELYQFPPDPHPFPLELLRSSHQLSWERPVRISRAVYEYTMQPRFPLFIVFSYILAVIVWNMTNKQRKNRPAAYAQTPAFRTFILFHNTTLAVFSMWAVIGLSRAINYSFPKHVEVSFITFADTMCKVHGPQGVGNGYMGVYSRFMDIPEILGNDGPTNRLWDQGLGYFGWIIFMSKIYELGDTFIQLSKGKRSSFLHTYHHAGAIVCAWMGARYMVSAAIVPYLINLAIHILMYSYYAIAGLQFRVPLRMKQLLTSLQIAQFFVALALSWVYFFVAYDIPITSKLSESPPRSNISAESSGLLVEGNGRYRTVHCLDSSGQVFSYLCATAYVIPLIILFMRFFAKSYLGMRKAKVT